MKKYIIFLIVIFSHLSANANGVNLSCALDQNMCDRCPEYQTIFPVEKFSQSTGALDIEADESEIIEEKYLLSRISLWSASMSSAPVFSENFSTGNIV